MGKTAFLFPGQASQYPGMGKELAENHPAARAVFDEADRALGFSISQMCFAGTEDELKLTANTQPAILTCSVEIASQLGAKRTVMLPVSAPFHSALMMPAQERLEKDLRAASFSNLRVPLVTNVDADTVSTGDEARDALVRQVSMPVRWEESVRLLIDEGVTTFVEVGPGRVLTGLLRQIERSVAALNVEDEKSLGATLDKIAQARSDAA